MRQRLLTAFIGIPLIVGALWLGGWVWTLLLAFVGAAGVYEVYRLAKAGGRHPDLPVGLALAPALVLVGLAPAWDLDRLALALGVIAAFGAQILRPAEQRSVDDWAITIAGPVYVGGLLGFGVLLRDLPGGLAWTLAGVGLVWANDSFAYFGGRAWGRRPLSPTLSPKKTREGFLVGGLATVLLALCLPWLAAWLPGTQAASMAGATPWGMAALGLVVALVAPFGDLAKSFLKRQVGVKDSGTLFPGHGGVLDRTDSLLFAAPFVYLGARLITALGGSG